MNCFKCKTELMLDSHNGSLQCPNNKCSMYPPPYHEHKKPINQVMLNHKESIPDSDLEKMVEIQ